MACFCTGDKKETMQDKLDETAEHFRKLDKTAEHFRLKPLRPKNNTTILGLKSN